MIANHAASTVQSPSASHLDAVPEFIDLEQVWMRLACFSAPRSQVTTAPEPQTSGEGQFHHA